MDTYELQLEEFRGPLEKLLELIEAKELEITRLSLAEVTADFLDYVRKIEEVHPRSLSDFIAVAARLVLIKSHAILPQFELTEQEEKDIRDLEERLHIYSEFHSAERHIAENWMRGSAYARGYLLELPPGFYLTEPVTAADLHGRMEELYRDLQLFMPRTEAERMALVSLEEMIQEVLVRVDKVIQTSFNDITEGRERSEVIALFLAILHLLKDSLIDIQQDGVFAEIRILRNGE